MICLQVYIKGSENVFSVKIKKFTIFPEQIGCKELVKTNFMEIVDPFKNAWST